MTDLELATGWPGNNVEVMQAGDVNNLVYSDFGPLTNIGYLFGRCEQGRYDGNCTRSAFTCVQDSRTVAQVPEVCQNDDDDPWPPTWTPPDDNDLNAGAHGDPHCVNSMG